jgi:hypothetical protein
VTGHLGLFAVRNIIQTQVSFSEVMDALNWKVKEIETSEGVFI